MDRDEQGFYKWTTFYVVATVFVVLHSLTGCAQGPTKQVEPVAHKQRADYIQWHNGVRLKCMVIGVVNDSEQDEWACLIENQVAI